ncbi:amino acid ABC transporter substrate-binding protein [Streptomyces sp. NPDC091972]|uniref:amino acid ABC transporter substrate-binding protein n=1 Tax=Streptomyces sp. NPDC091972 TaxID=3366007 RepID=UPI003801FBD1
MALHGSVAALFLGAFGTSCGLVNQEETGPITIGISLPLSGPVADSSKPAYAGYKVWAEQVNKKDGLLGRKVKLKVLDDGFDEGRVVSNYRRLIHDEHVDLLLGTVSSKLNLPASSVAEQAKMLYVEPSGGADEIFNRGYNYLFFAQPGTSVDVPEGLVEWVRQLPKTQRPRTAAYPVQNDPNLNATVEQTRKELSSLGVRTVYTDTYAPETRDFSGIAQDIAAAAPDLIVHGAVSAEDGGGLIKALQGQGFNPKLIFQTNAPSLTDVYPKAVGGEANTAGIFTSLAWNPQGQGSKDFIDAYERKYGEPPEDDAASAYTAGQVLASAVWNVGSLDQEKLSHWLHQHSVPTVSGVLHWDKRGVPEGDFMLAQWQKGKLEIISPEELRTTSKALYPKPDWS